jgi:hypothetical protein
MDRFWLVIASFVVTLTTPLAGLFLTVREFSTEYSYTRIVCSVPENNISYCQDAIITCKGNKVMSVKLLGDPVKMNYTESPLGWCEK